jgi:diaminohydroxyphosphoribosylaminopyrimidine deaminase/5-amino-6-(5-phosphoribosylamino)uracil reductase
MNDHEYMRVALALARRGLGRTATNPSVGCVLVKGNIVVGRGWTGDGGRPHAEAAALMKAGAAARGATAYVTLEPCSHYGKTPPCAAALINAAVKRVVVGAIDPDPRVSGTGISMLRAAGIQVDMLENGPDEINHGFFLRLTEKRPLVTLKMAVTNDGMFTPESGKQEWITGDLARRHVHLERSNHDAVLSTIRTVVNDNPLLTTRLEGIVHKAPRIILDSNLEIMLDSQLIRTINDAPVWVFHTLGPEEKIRRLEDMGVRVFNAGSALPEILKTIAQQGVTRLFFEGGGRALHAFAEAGFCDRFLLYRAPRVNWPDGRKLGLADIILKSGLNMTGTRILGEDLLEIYERKA